MQNVKRMLQFCECRRATANHSLRGCLCKFELWNYKLFYTFIKTSKLCLWHFIVLLTFIKTLFVLEACVLCFTVSIKIYGKKNFHIFTGFPRRSCSRNCFSFSNFPLKRNVFIDFSLPPQAGIHFDSFFLCLHRLPMESRRH
jgi:hypothetical protein